MLKPWLRFFRVVNLPTVPGDVLVGAAAVATGMSSGRFSVPFQFVAVAGLSSVFLYMFGLTDNDIVGAKTDEGRPISSGEISLAAACLARLLCVALALALPLVGVLSISSFAVALLVVAAAFSYNRTKSCLLMGLCRGLNVLLGAAAVLDGCGSGAFAEVSSRGWLVLSVVVVAWTVYIAAVTRYSEGEEDDPSLKFRVGMLVGAIVYLQLIVLVMIALCCAAVKPLLVVGAVLLVVLRLSKTMLPSVSAS